MLLIVECTAPLHPAMQLLWTIGFDMVGKRRPRAQVLLGLCAALWDRALTRQAALSAGLMCMICSMGPQVFLCISARCEHFEFSMKTT